MNFRTYPSATRPAFGAYTPRAAASPRAGPAGESRTALRLVAYSLLILFFELCLIRYTAAYVRIFGFYANFVLIAAFLGMGVGLLRTEAATRIKWLAIPASLLLVGAVVYLSQTVIAVPHGPAEYLWAVYDASGKTGVPLFWAVVLLFTLCTLFFVPLGALMGAEFRALPALRAYSFDIAGSLLGIIAFAAVSAARHPPIVWFAMGFGLWVVASLGDRRFAIALGATGVAITLATSPRASGPEYWSPYYRITVAHGSAGSNVFVNGSLHQVMLDLSDSAVDRWSYTRTARAGYLRPYEFAARIDTALVVGSGTGNDVALLLRLGAKHIDAVEIDPVILDLGRATHAQQPYADPRVHTHIDDARAFLRKTRQTYNVIVFGTLDSQTLLSGMSSVRLDNYVYTVESFRSARDRLKPDGTVIVYHMAGFSHIAAKIYAMLAEAFEAPPGVLVENRWLFNYTFIAGHGARDAASPAPPPELTGRVPHDDWPYLYLQRPSLPSHYATALAAVLMIAVAGLAAAGGGRALARGFDGAMFLMGVGFLLVETKSVTEMSLLFGSTWTVNLLVFSSILSVVLAANIAVLRVRTLPSQWLFGALFASLAAAYAIPASQLLWLGPAAQWIVASLMVALPVLFASLIFSTLLRRRVDPTSALACNLLGAVVGGLLEYSSMAGGIKFLYVVAAVAYAGAALFVIREGRRLPA
jgi:SAM-dependent methyltransferase